MLFKRTLWIACLALALAPSPALGVSLEFDVPGTFSTITGVLTLVLAIVLLVVTLQLRRVAEGSAIVGNIAFVMGGSLCLAASVLLGFLERFVASWLGEDLVRAAADLLVFMAMLFFVLYFNAVRMALVGFLRTMSDDEAFAVAQAGRDAGELVVGGAGEAPAERSAADGGEGV